VKSLSEKQRQSPVRPDRGSLAAQPGPSLWKPVLEQMPGFILELDWATTILAASHDARRFLGVGPGGKLEDFVDLAQHEELTSTLARVMDNVEHRATLSLWLRRNDGALRLVEGTIAMAGTAAPHRTLLWTATDVTARVDDSRQLRNILEGLSQGIIIHRGGRCLFANTAMVELVHFPSMEALLQQSSILPYIHPDDREMVATNVQARLSGEYAPPNYQFRLVAADDEVVWVDCRSSVLMWEGAPAVLACCYDITNRVQAEKAQEKASALFSKVFETSPDFIVLSRLDDWSYVNVNNSFCEQFGYTKEEIIGKTVRDVGIWLNLEQRQQLIDRVKTEGSVRGFEFKGGDKAGNVHDLIVSADIISYENQQLLLVIGRDITERKQQEQELIANKEAADLANRAKSEFLANMSHELRTPLNAILGFSEIIKNQIHGVIGEQKYVEYAADIYDSGSHLLSIINDILDLSKVEAGRLEVHEAAFSFPEVLGNCIRLITPRIQEAGLRLSTHVADPLPLLIADERLIKQILLNLLSNAVKFTPSGGSITVAAGINEAGEFEASVTDTGIGMDEVGIAKALTPFGQVDSSLNRKHEGTGLGLPLVAAFVKRQGGRLIINSSLGQGTTVKFTLPADRLQAE
jgi:PAS domain S-box-containing protein